MYLYYFSVLLPMVVALLSGKAKNGEKKEPGKRGLLPIRSTTRARTLAHNGQSNREHDQ